MDAAERHSVNASGASSKLNGYAASWTHYVNMRCADKTGQSTPRLKTLKDLTNCRTAVVRKRQGAGSSGAGEKPHKRTRGRVQGEGERVGEFKIILLGAPCPPLPCLI